MWSTMLQNKNTLIMNEVFTKLSSRIDLYQSFINFFEPEFVKEVVKIETEKEESDDGFIAPLKLAVVSRYEEEFRFYLNRYLYDLEVLLRLSTPKTRKAIINELNEQILFYDEFSNKKEICQLVSERNNFKIKLTKEHTGELRKSASTRKEIEKFDFKNTNRKIQYLYFEVVIYYVKLHNSYLHNLISIGTHKPNTYHNNSSVLKISLDKFIPEDKWERFIRICDFYSKERDYFGKHSNVKLINYDDEKKQYEWLGIGKSFVPAMAEFIMKLESEKIVKQKGEKKGVYILAFTIFFNMKYDHEFNKHIGKEMNKRTGKFNLVFSHVSNVK